MTLEQVLNWLLLPALGAIAWIARSVSRMETQITSADKNIAEIWKHVNTLTREISDAREAIAQIKGRLEH